MGNGNAIIATLLARGTQPHVQFPVWPLASMGFVVQPPKHTTGTTPPLLSPPSIKASDVDTSGTAQPGEFQPLWGTEAVNLPQFLLVTQTNNSSLCRGEVQASDGQRTSLQVVQLQHCQTLPSSLPLENILL